MNDRISGLGRFVDGPVYTWVLRNLALLTAGYLLGLWSAVAYLGH